MVDSESSRRSDIEAKHYARTALARMGIPFERGMQVAGVREAIEGAIRAEERRRNATGDGQSGTSPFDDSSAGVVK